MTKDLTPKQIRNRELYPEMAAFVDEMREVFGDVKFVSFVSKPDSVCGGIQKVEQVVAQTISGPRSLDLPANCKAPLSKTDKRATEKQRQLERMVADGLIKFGGD